MALLYNRIAQKELKKRLYDETEKRITLSFYRYFPVTEPQEFRDALYKALSGLDVFGRIYVAREGINAQVSVPESKFASFQTYINSVIPSETGSLRLNIAVDDDGKSFWVLKIKTRDKIVADGITDASFDMTKKGGYVSAEEFNRLTEEKDTLIVDMRNHYEYEVGHFENAIEIPSDTFRDQLPMAVEMLEGQKEKTIIMYCTGGIRCEKASAYMKHNGFEHVYHLEGGIIHYANTVKEKHLPNKFTGKNFVFDNRLGEKIGEEIIAKCHQCGKPADTHVNCRNEGCHLLFIQCAECAEKYEGCCSEECLAVIRLPEEERKHFRKGIDKGRNVFNKSKARLRPRLEPPPGN